MHMSGTNPFVRFTNNKPTPNRNAQVNGRMDDNQRAGIHPIGICIQILRVKKSADSVLNFKIEMDNVVYIFSGKRKQQRNILKKIRIKSIASPFSASK